MGIQYEGDALRALVREYGQHKPGCEVLTGHAVEIVCPHCDGTGRAKDPKHQMKDRNGQAWADNNCAPCAGTKDYTVLKYPQCTCGFSQALAGLDGGA